MPEFRSRPEQYPVVGALGRYLQKADEFARKPFGYENPPAALISDFLDVPAVYRTAENINYGSPLTRGTGQARQMTDDTKGALMGAANLAPLVPAAARMVKPVAKAAAPYAAQHAVNLVEKYGVSPTMNVVKPKGGNWIKGSVEESLIPYRRAVREPRYMEEIAWRDQHGLAPEGLLASTQEQNKNAEAVNKWIDTKLAKYIRNEMGTAEDPVRALAEEGVLHYSPTRAAPNSQFENVIMNRREQAGMPITGLGESELARAWEDAADFAVVSVPSHIRTSELKLRGNYGAQRTLADNPWLETLSRDTPVYEADPERLNFHHLVDELKNAMDVSSDLPKALRIDPKDIDKITVPQAVKRVSEINAWRADQAAKAEREGMMANLQATPRLSDENLQFSFVEKPGGAWIDIPETVNDKGMKLCTSIGKAGGWCTQGKSLAESYGSGENRLVALVDAEGRPHAQAKITQDVDQAAAVEDASMYLTPEQEIAYDNHFSKFDRPPELEESLEWIKENAPDAYKVYKAVMNSQPKSPPNITELKPPGNSFSSDRAQEYAKRDPEYGPKLTQSVLKFLNSGEWGKVNDLNQYGIVDLQRDPVMLTQYLRRITNGAGDADAQAIFNAAIDANPNAPRFMTTIQLRDFIEGSMSKPTGFARGGSVNFATGGHAEYDDDLIRQMAAELVDVQQERAAESGDIPEASLLDTLKNFNPLGGRVSSGPFSLDAWTHNKGLNLRGSVGTDNLRGYVDVDPREKKVSQLGVTYEDMNPKGGYYLNASMDPETREKTLNAMYRKQLSDGSELMVGGTHRPDNRQTMLNLMYRYGFAQGGAVHMEKGGRAKQPSPFDEMEPTFGDKMGAWVSDKLTEGAINLYDKLSNRDRMSAAHKIYLDTFARDNRDPITAKDFNTDELAELQNMIRQKEKLSGGKGKGYIEYKDYDNLTGGNQRKAIAANLIGGVMPPRPSLAKSLGQFNYELDPKTKQYRIIDEYDFNPQQTTYQGRKIDIPIEHYGDYLSEMSPYALARLYGGRKMPPGTGRKVELSVPYAKGGAVEFNPEEIDMMVAQLTEE